MLNIQEYSLQNGLQYSYSRKVICDEVRSQVGSFTEKKDSVPMGISLHDSYSVEDS